MELFTDWTLTDPHYFYLRGAMWGAVVATIVQIFIRGKS